MALRADPGGVFASDQHRRVLGHLSHPDDDYGWTGAALAHRTGITEDLEPILRGLAKDGDAEKNAAGAWRMTQQGFDQLTGPVASDGEEGPAQIAAQTARAGTATAWEAS